MSFKRTIEANLFQWKESLKRKPLIIRGARQVGKTTLIKSFSESYSRTIMLNLEKPAHRRYFEDFDDVQSIIEALFLGHGIPSSEINKTLLFIDEIQESPKAIQLLRYFYEEIPALHVISAGSLLEFVLQKVESFPVGRVEFLYLHPLNFEEYLRANNKAELVKYLYQVPIKPVAHQLLIDAFHRYSIIGGMPEIIKIDQEQKNLSDLPMVYESIWGTYKNDVEKYTLNDTSRRIINHIMNTAHLFLDKRITFQGFGNSNYKSREVGEAFRILDDAKIIRLIYPSTDIEVPIIPDLKKSPRLQFLDTGLINYTLGIQAEMLALDDLSSAYKGAVIPHLFTQEIISLGKISEHKPNFWVRDKKQSSAEVDLLYPYKNLVIPIEIKSGSTGSLKSLHQFVDTVSHPYAIRVYGGQFKLERSVTPNGKPYLLLNIPYYLGTRIAECVTWLIDQTL
ncbi:ATP-binding protein [Pedobacter sp.]|uniref:ATP-binding protein n=1 Tax=Pedobacter sp. TaxID=1411316 RepID=UPI003BABA38B